MVYTSTSLSLAALELFVHLEPGLAPADLVYLSAILPEGEPARTLDSAELPADWWADGATLGALTTRQMGDAWIIGRSSLAMMVPSVPIRAEWNVLVNPLHPRMSEVQIGSPEPFVFDARMFQQGQP
jgi:RES domain-containing protein